MKKHVRRGKALRNEMKRKEKFDLHRPMLGQLLRRVFAAGQVRRGLMTVEEARQQFNIGPLDA